MLDINLIRKNPQLIKENLKKRNNLDKIKWVDDLLEKDKESLNIKKQVESLRHKRNIISQRINELLKQGKKATKEISEAKELPQKIESLEKRQDEFKEKIKYYLWNLPNILHKSVPLGKDASDNKVIKKWGKIPKFRFPIKNHIEIIESLNLGDFEQSALVSGSKFYYLKGKLALLNQALIKFALDFLVKKGYTYIETPLMLRKKAIDGALDLNTFQDMIYKIEGEDLYLIGTAEHSLLAYHMNQILEGLPKKYVSYTMCFRKELGSHGIDEKGLYRTHQFNKIEQFIFCNQNDSYKYYNELLKNSEQLFQKLKLPYRILEICSGDMGSIKTKSCDLELWMPHEKNYKEACSLSNCTDYQARRLNIKYFNKKTNKKEVIHTLNNTAIATSRALIAILENNQQKDGTIKIPLVLQKYLNFKKLEKSKN